MNAVLCLFCRANANCGRSRPAEVVQSSAPTNVTSDDDALETEEADEDGSAVIGQLRIGPDGMFIVDEER